MLWSKAPLGDDLFANRFADLNPDKNANPLQGKSVPRFSEKSAKVILKRLEKIAKKFATNFIFAMFAHDLKETG